MSVINICIFDRTFYVYIYNIMNPTVEEQLRAAVMLGKLLLDIYHETRELSQMGAGRVGCLLNEIQRQPENGGPSPRWPNSAA